MIVSNNDEFAAELTAYTASQLNPVPVTTVGSGLYGCSFQGGVCYFHERSYSLVTHVYLSAYQQNLFVDISVVSRELSYAFITLHGLELCNIIES